MRSERRLGRIRLVERKSIMMKDNSTHYPEVVELDAEDLAAASGGWQTVKAGSSWNSIRS